MRLALARGDLSDAGRPGGLYGIDFEWPEPVTQSSVILITTNFGLSLALIVSRSFIGSGKAVCPAR